MECQDACHHEPFGKRLCNSFQGVIIKRLYQSFHHWPTWVCCHGWFFGLMYVLVQQLGGLFESHILLVALLLPLGKLWLKGLDFQALLVHGLIRLLVLIQHTGRKFTRSIASLVSSISRLFKSFPSSKVTIMPVFYSKICTRTGHLSRGLSVESIERSCCVGVLGDSR